MTTALTLLVVCLLGGLGLGVSGVYLLWGIGWAMLVGAAVLITVAVVIYKGMTADAPQ